MPYFVFDIVKTGEELGLVVPIWGHFIFCRGIVESGKSVPDAGNDWDEA